MYKRNIYRALCEGRKGENMYKRDIEHSVRGERGRTCTRYINFQSQERLVSRIQKLAVAISLDRIVTGSKNLCTYFLSL